GLSSLTGLLPVGTGLPVIGGLLGGSTSTTGTTGGFSLPIIGGLLGGSANSGLGLSSLTGLLPVGTGLPVIGGLLGGSTSTTGTTGGFSLPIIGGLLGGSANSGLGLGAVVPAAATAGLSPLSFVGSVPSIVLSGVGGSGFGPGSLPAGQPSIGTVVPSLPSFGGIGGLAQLPGVTPGSLAGGAGGTGPSPAGGSFLTNTLPLSQVLSAQPTLAYSGMVNRPRANRSPASVAASSGTDAEGDHSPETLNATALTSAPSPVFRPGCGCDAGSGLTIGTPTVNGQPAGTLPGPGVTVGQPVVVVVPVSNSGTTTITGISGSTTSGAMQCGATSLAAGASTTCTYTTTGQSGTQIVPVAVSGTGPTGPVATTGTVYYTGTTPGGTTGQLTVSNPTVNNTPAGSAPGPQVTTGQPAQVTVTVTDSGTTPVSAITSTTPNGSMQCTDTSLTVGQSTTCTITSPAQSGAVSVPVSVTGSGPDGSPITSGTTVYYTGTPGGTTGGQLTVSNPTVNNNPADSAPGPQVTTGQPAQVTVTVTDSGTTPISAISGTSPSGNLQCANSSLTAG
ncbi:MAG: hypothetical protein J0H43_04880, partial [Actinobacteria bacterium]|nr:hypothetical protein [Actinomycetota bacterium]